MATMRLPGYDYSLPGQYFVTICTKDRQSLFGHVRGQRMQVNAFGHTVQQCWLNLPNHYSCLLDSFTIMPNHVHGIIVIPDEPLPSPVARGLNPWLRGDREHARQHPLTEIVRGFKTFSAAAVNRLRGTPGAALWQRSFHEHILRTESDAENVREYVRLNPANWQTDRHNPG